jgi:hypothetical protein
MPVELFVLEKQPRVLYRTLQSLLHTYKMLRLTRIIISVAHVSVCRVRISSSERFVFTTPPGQVGTAWEPPEIHFFIILTNRCTASIHATRCGKFGIN